MIQADKITKHYGPFAALDGLDLCVERGDVLGFIGPNGAGKTTAMKIICGIMPPTSGSVRISGFSMENSPEAAKAKLGYLPENAPLYPGMSVHSFLKFTGSMRGLSGKQLDSAIAKVSDQCCLDEVMRQDVEALSKGFRRRVCLAQSLIHSPENLVLDEPTDGLDPDQKRDIRSLILRLRETTAVIVSTHILEDVGAVCTRVLAIREGLKVFDGTTAEFEALSPDAGTVVFTVSGGSCGLNLFGTLPSVHGMQISDLTVTLRPKRGCADSLPGEIAAFAAEHKFVIRKMEILRVDPGKIFSALGKNNGGAAC